MTAIEPGCLAWAAGSGISAFVTVVDRYPMERHMCTTCRKVDRFWLCEGFPEPFELACECCLHRIDGYDETEDASSEMEAA